MFSNRVNSLQKHLFNLQSDEKNYIFNFSIYSKQVLEPYSSFFPAVFGKTKSRCST